MRRGTRGTRRLNIDATRSRGKRNFNFGRWLYRLFAIPVAIAAIAFGIFSLVLLVSVTLGAVATYGIAWWWRRRKLAPSAPVRDAFEGEYVVVDPAAARGLGQQEIAARVQEPAGSPR